MARVKVDGVRFNWLWVDKPKEYENESGEKHARYEATLIVEPGSSADKAIEAGIEAAAEEKWGEKAEGVLKRLRTQNRVCYKDGNSNLDKEGEIRDGFADMKYLTPYRAEKKGPVKVLNRAGGNALEEGGLPQNGDYGAAMFNIWAQDNPKGGQRINAEISIVMKKRDGDSLGGSFGVSEDDVSAFASEFAEEIDIPDTETTGGLRK